MINISQFFSRFYIAKKAGIYGNHYIHTEGCPLMPEKDKRIFLGVFSSGKDALKEGAVHFGNSECCRFCLKEEPHVKREFVFAEIVSAVNLAATSKIQPSYLDALYVSTN